MFEASVSAQGNIAIIEMSGELNSIADESMTSAYDKAVAFATAKIVLNFANVDYINSTGIALIVGTVSKARKDGKELSATGLTDHYKEIFEITRLAEFITIHQDLPTALSNNT